jgi:hypothetical protein
MIESELYTHLKDSVTSVSARIYPLLMPQNCVKPAIVYGVVYDGDIQTLGCTVGRNIRFQIDLYGESYQQVKTIKEEIKQALYSFRSKPLDLSTMDGYEEGTKLHRQRFDFKFKL